MTSKTNFQKVVEFNRVFGLPDYDKPQMDIFDRDPKLVDLRLSLIKEEVRELEDGIKNKDMDEVLDALSDILYVVYGAGSSFGLDLDKGMSLVHDSNMTKSCVSEEEAILTVEWYKKNEKRYDSPAYRKSDCGSYWVIYNKSTGKILKSINYKPVNFDKMLNES